MRDIIPRNEHTKGSEKSAAFFAASDAIRRKTKKKEEARQRRWRAQNTEGQKRQRKIKKERTPKNIIKICVCQKFFVSLQKILEVQQIFGRF